MADRLSLRDLADVNPESLGTGTAASFEFRYIDLASVSNGRIDWASTSVQQFGSSPSRARRLLRDGDVLFGTVRPALRSHAALRSGPSVCVASTGFAVVRARDGVSDSRFLAHYLLSDICAREARRVEVGSNYPSVNESDVRRFGVPAFAIVEQRRIAEVLDTLDDTIAATDGLVEKLRSCEEGLRSELIAFGSAEASLAECCELIQDGTHLPPARVTEGPLLLSVQNMHGGTLRLTGRDTHVPRIFYESTLRTLPIEEGDVCLAVVGATIGKVALVPRLPAFTIQRSITVLRGRAGVMRSRYLFEVLRTADFQTRLWQRANQTAQPGVYLNELRQIRVPCPPEDAQERAVAALMTLGEQRRAAEAELAKLRLLREGLADDLLTARVRTVPV